MYLRKVISGTWVPVSNHFKTPLIVLNLFTGSFNHVTGHISYILRNMFNVIGRTGCLFRNFQDKLIIKNI